MFCVKCGSEMADDVQFCPKCGNVVSSTTGDITNSTERKRHGFTSFWLIFSLISYFIAGSIYISSPELITQYLDVSDEIVILFGIVSIFGIVGDILLLCWKKNRFLGYCRGFDCFAIIQYVNGLGYWTNIIWSCRDCDFMGSITYT